MRVLVVDDEISVCSCVADFLRQEGFDVIEAFDAFGALKIASDQGETISAVVSDVNMPGMDGFSMWEQMKPLVSRNCKIVFMTGLARKYLDDGARFPGALLQKPFSLDILIEKLVN